MKNFPHQFNDLNKLFDALSVIRDLINEQQPLTDDIFGERLTRSGIYTYRDRTLSVDEYLEIENRKDRSNRGYLTVARDIRRLFQLLSFVSLSEEKEGELSPNSIQLLASETENDRKECWRNSFLQLALDLNGDVSHPYRILLKLTQDRPGLETSKLMLALEANDDSSEEYERILELTDLSFEEIVEAIGTTISMARNAVKILPGVAEQLGDIERRNNKAFPTSQIIITEDEISTEISEISPRGEVAQFRQVNIDNLAQNPQFNAVVSTSIDLAEAIRVRQQRHAQHQTIVRGIGQLCGERGLSLYEGKYDCFATNNDRINSLFEIKTITTSKSDQEKQIVKGVGQLKYYKYSIVQQRMRIQNIIQEYLVLSMKPRQEFIDFCKQEGVNIVWVNGDSFTISLEEDTLFDPINV